MDKDRENQEGTKDMTQLLQIINAKGDTGELKKIVENPENSTGDEE